MGVCDMRLWGALYLQRSIVSTSLRCGALLFLIYAPILTAIKLLHRWGLGMEKQLHPTILPRYN